AHPLLSGYGDCMDLEEKRQKNRLKVRRWRQRNKNRLAMAAELQASGGRGGTRPRWRVVELVHVAGEWAGLPAAIIAIREGDALPAEIDGHPVAIGGDWLPRGNVSREMARMLRSYRLEQICRWAGGWPEWLTRP